MKVHIEVELPVLEQEVRDGVPYVTEGGAGIDDRGKVTGTEPVDNDFLNESQDGLSESSLARVESSLAWLGKASVV